MNFEQHDNLLLADWTAMTTPLSEKGQEEVDQLEKFIYHTYDLAAKDQIQAVLWLQKVPCSDGHEDWLHELRTSVLRDQLRWRLARLFSLRRLIQESPVPWIYVTEKDCCGSMFEFMMACHRRYVFDRQTWFGFPELILEQLPALGWLAPQIQKRPKSYELWQKRMLMSAEEAVQIGIVSAALYWKDWRRDIIAWSQRQIESLYRESDWTNRVPSSPVVVKDLWAERREAVYLKTHVQSYLQRADIRPRKIDEELIDSAAHFMLQAPYEAWLKREIHQKRKWGRLENLVYFDINDALPPLALIAKLLDRGVRLAFFAKQSSELHSGLDTLFAQLEARYTRQRFGQFENQISWFVGTAPARSIWMVIRFGKFRDVDISLGDMNIQGWAMASGIAERQVLEINAEARNYLAAITPLFDVVYCVQGDTRRRPLLFKVRSLILQVLVFYCQDTGESLEDVLEQLKGTGWGLLGSQRYWEKFLEYRSVLSNKDREFKFESIGIFSFDKAISRVSQWRQLVELCRQRRGHELHQGAGFLHRSLCSVASLLAKSLVEQGRFDNLHEADLYVADAIGFPERWGTPETFARRMGRFTDAEVKRGLIELPVHA